MNKSEFKDGLRELLSGSIAELAGWEQKLSFARQTLVELDKETAYDQTNKRNSWTDDELRLILQLPPNKENIMKIARAFKRGYGSIEQIYRWAAEDAKTVSEKRPDDAFIQQIKRVASEVGWRAT